MDLSHLRENTSEISHISLSIKGEIPHWLKGVYIHNGPGILKGKEGHVKHWFNGLAKLKGFYINNGQVTYSCQFLKSDAYKEFEKSGNFDSYNFAQEKIPIKFSIINFLRGSKNQRINNANVNVAKINQKLVALTEAPLPVEIDIDLNTIGYFDYDDNLPKNFSFESAHVLIDPGTKETWNFLINIGLFKTSYQIYRIAEQSAERKLLATIPVNSISYIHSFSLAGHYLVLIDYPLRCNNPRNIANGFIESFSWQPDQPSRCYVIDRRTGDYRVYEIDPFFSFHHVNGFEKEGKIYVDLVAYSNAEVIWGINKYPNIKNDYPNRLMRLEIDPKSNRTKLTPLSIETFEFPRLNNSLIAQDYQYLYAVHFHTIGSGLIKFDHRESKHLYWAEDDCYANEPVFVPKPYSTCEDDGSILSIINNLNTEESFLLILDASDFKEIARVKAPHLIPFGFHGNFFQ